MIQATVKTLIQTDRITVRETVLNQVHHEYRVYLGRVEVAYFLGDREAAISFADKLRKELDHGTSIY